VPSTSEPRHQIEHGRSKGREVKPNPKEKKKQRYKNFSCRSRPICICFENSEFESEKRVEKHSRNRKFKKKKGVVFTTPAAAPPSRTAGHRARPPPATHPSPSEKKKKNRERRESLG